MKLSFLCVGLLCLVSCSNNTASNDTPLTTVANLDVQLNPVSRELKISGAFESSQESKEVFYYRGILEDQGVLKQPVDESNETSIVCTTNSCESFRVSLKSVRSDNEVTVQLERVEFNASILSQSAAPTTLPEGLEGAWQGIYKASDGGFDPDKSGLLLARVGQSLYYGVFAQSRSSVWLNISGEISAPTSSYASRKGGHYTIGNMDSRATLDSRRFSVEFYDRTIRLDLKSQ